jgi:glycerophosphoryl diester phosphodiesterase
VSTDAHLRANWAGAHAAGLAVHPYTIRADSLPPTVRSLDDLHSLLFIDAKVDGLFTDFPDRTSAWLTSHPSPSN